jgi:membrane fusion protein (multidrug efflux system)
MLRPPAQPLALQPTHGSPVTVWVGIAALLGACSQSSTPTAVTAVAMPLAEVGVVSVTPGDVGLITELPGRLEASRVAQVRARVPGILQKRLFTEGSDVRAGQALFQVDAGVYEAALASAQAQVAKSEANLMQASAQADRFKPLAAAKAISEQDFINAQAAQKLAAADLAVARAAVQTANINLGEATQLAVIQQTDPMYINFTQSAAEVMKLRRAMDNGQLKRAGNQAASVKVLLEDGTAYARSGKLLFSDLTVDSTSGQITLRAEIPNPQGTLLPGLFVRVQLEQAQAANAITLAQQAVTRTPQGDTVMVVGTDGKVTPRPIKIGGQQNGQWVVLGGLQAGEQVMVDGFQKLRGPAPVKPVPWTAGAAKPASGSAGPAAAPASTPASGASATR